jgi:hypothetical protein
MIHFKVILKIPVLFVLLIRLNLTFSQQIPANIDRSGFMPIDSLIYTYEQKNNLRIYFQPVWFENKKLHVSTINLSVDDFLFRLTETARCSLITLDSASVKLP